MEKLKTYVLNTYNSIPAPIYGLLSAIVGLSGDVISIALFEGYNFNRMISVLGTGPGGIRTDHRQHGGWCDQDVVNPFVNR